MLIGLYFGSFNPIHNGHLILASHVINFTSLDQVWLVISPQNPFKQNTSLLNEQHRLHLVRTALEGEHNIKATDIEFKLPRPSYTINTLQYLQEKYPQHIFSIILGSDGLQNFTKWKNYKAILAKAQLYVYPRPCFDFMDIEGASIVKLDGPLLNISSTHVRKLLRQGKSIRFLVPDNVKAEIESNGYYTSKSENPTQE